MNTQSILRFYERAAALKSLDRAGWRRCGVGDRCESVAEHSFGVALLALIVARHADPSIDRDRCVALALVHDLAEAIVGDITPHDGVDPADKHAREERAMRDLTNALDDKEILQLSLEFESAASAEARLVRDLDVIEMAIQARRYENAGSLGAENARGFVESARRRVTTDAGRQLLEAAAGG